jgi:copper(I)-binding protein
VIAPRPVRSWLHDPGKVGYLIVATLVNTGVFAYLTFSPLPLYSTYELAPPVVGISTRDDQLLAGLLMKMGGAVILWTAITILFFRWVGRSERDDGVLPGAALVILLAGSVVACGPVGDGTDGDAPVADAVEAAWVDLGPVRVRNARIGEPPTGDRAALYFDVGTSGAPGDSGDAVRIVGVEARGVGRAELHETTLDDGMMRMRPVEALVLRPGEERVLAPGGLHVMLLDLESPLAVGDSVEVRLRIEGVGSIPPFTARVVPLAEVGEGG